MSGQCLCSWCVEARGKIRGYVPGWITDWWLPEPQHPELPAADLRGLAAYDQARSAKTSAWTAEECGETVRTLHDEVARLGVEMRVAVAGARAHAMREARERAGASCP